MKTHPILFNTEMVQAILDGKKTQTRRIISETPGTCVFCGCTHNDCSQCIQRTGEPCYWTNETETICSACADLKNISKAKYNVGDILWVRETFTYSDDLDEPYWFKQKFKEEYIPECVERIKWSPSIHMPKEAARIFLKVTKVRAERLQDMSEGDAIAEGVELMDTNSYKDYSDFRNGLRRAKVSFATLWDTIYGDDEKKEWLADPFVWIYEFELTAKPKYF